MNSQQDTARNGTTHPARPGRRRKLALAAGLTAGTVGVIAGGFGGSASAIVDGEETTVSANPWQVALTSPDGEQFCGGSIVSDRIIVTAAHCTQGQAEGDIAVRAGTSDLTSNDGQTRNVTAVIEHPKYVQGVGDIAMLVLDTPLDMGSDVQAITLATAADIDAASSARVTGWGVQSETAEGTPSVLQSADVPLVSDADCSLVDDGNEDELCAGGTGTDSCYGDSGGPLTVATDNGQALAGVVSWGEECGGESAGVYAEVPTFATWVAERIANPDAPAGERLPAAEDGPGGEEGDFDEDDFDEHEGTELSQEFIDSVGGFDALDEMSDEEFWNAYEDYMDENGSNDTTGSDVDVEQNELDELDTNGDNIVQWSELEPGFDDDGDSPDTNGDNIVNWDELIDA